MDHTKLDFTMDPNLLVSVIKMQAGTLSKALLEGIMNSIDAGASRVDVTLDQTTFTITDNGRGFSSETEIKEFFGRFGTPHTEGDALYGRFRMGRGQMMAFAATVWCSGRFEMTVDIETDGLTYKLRELETPAKGCSINGKLYQPLPEWKLRETLEELRKFVKYAPKPVYVNGELFGANPSRLTSWTHEDEYAYYRIIQGADVLQVYNLGVFVEEMSSWRLGVGGVVVSKQALEVNFARNSVMAEKCSNWRHIRITLERLLVSKLSRAKALNESERKYLATRLTDLDRCYPFHNWRALKLLTDPSGKHMPLSALSRFKRFVAIEDQPTLACSVHGVEDTFVVTGELMNRFGVSCLEDFLTRMKQVAAVREGEYEVIQLDDVAHLGLGGAKLLELDGLTKRESAAFKTLQALNEELAKRLALVEVTAVARELRVGTHRTGNFQAWTDGASYITVNRRHLKRLGEGFDGVLEWLLTLVHEYMHDTDDSESHDHGEVFYRKFHDTAFSPFLGLASLSRDGLRTYLEQLRQHGVSRPRRLSKQLRG